jgi:CheY-like chemotaxis protein
MTMAVSPAVLVADDSAVARLALARRLRAEGFEVIEHPSAASARRSSPIGLACALLDLDLGDGDGDDVARTLLARRSDLPVAFFSASTSPELVERARAIGPVFAKPGELDAAVEWVCSHGRPGAPG